MTGAEIALGLKLISLGIGVARQAVALHQSIENRERNEAQRKDALQEVIRGSTQSLKEAIDVSADRIIDKMEQDKLENLISRINNIDMLLRMNKPDEVLSYVLQLKETVDYARNRVDEGKEHWLMPYMTGVAMVAATFDYLGEVDHGTSKELEGLLQKAKERVLDDVTSALVKSGQSVPWDTVRGVLADEEGAVESYVAMLPPSTADDTSSVESLGTSVPATEQAMYYLGDHVRVGNGVKEGEARIVAKTTIGYAVEMKIDERTIEVRPDQILRKYG